MTLARWVRSLTSGKGARQAGGALERRFERPRIGHAGVPGQSDVAPRDNIAASRTAKQPIIVGCVAG